MKASGEPVSVVMPNFNKGGFALQAVQSVLAQDHTNFELLFVDDHSTDGSDAEVVALAACDPRLRCFQTPHRSGGAAARNLGLKAARGNYVLFMDSDDWMAPGALTHMATAFAAHPECSFIAFPMALFDKEPGDSPLITNIPKPRPDLLRFLERDHPWLISGPLWKRDFLVTLGGFDASLTSQQDFDLHVRALLEQPAYQYFAKPALVYYRQHVQSTSRETSQNLESLRMRADMLHRYLEIMDSKYLRTPDTDLAVAGYLLDLALMMRWHKETLGELSTQEGLRIWLTAHEYQLVTPRLYSRGMGYIRFCHNMLWNRVPSVQKHIETRYIHKLGPLLQQADITLSKCTLSDA